MSRSARSSVALVAKPLAEALVLITVLAAGCASVPPAQTAQDLKQIVGNWGGIDGVGTMTINETGRFRGVNAKGREFVGQVVVSEGRFRFKSETTGLSGTMTLYEGDGTRTLRTRTDDGSITAEFRAAKP